MLVDACKKTGVPVEAHLFPQGGHGLALGTAETAWQGLMASSHASSNGRCWPTRGYGDSSPRGQRA